MEMRDPEMAENVRSLMFVFEDMEKLDARTVQRILREVETKDLGLALKGAKEEVKTIVFENKIFIDKYVFLHLYECRLTWNFIKCCPTCR